MRIRLLASVVAFALAASGCRPDQSASAAPDPAGLQVRVPASFNLQVTRLGDAVIPGATAANGFGFADGRIVLASGDAGLWSDDGGKTWRQGVAPPPGKATIDLGHGEILALGGKTARRPDGRYALPASRSLDNWKTISRETETVDTPQAASLTGDEGERHDGMIMHHGVLRLKDGRLIATMYGNYVGDNEPADGYPLAMNIRKYRTIAVFSSDGGRTWSSPVTIAYDRMLARGTAPDARADDTAAALAITQEGFDEADLVRAPNGDILAIMRSGGRVSVSTAPVFPTPLYLSRSSDEGRSWSLPVQIEDRGTDPNAVALPNGVIALVYARPGAWITFSGDSGRTWTPSVKLAEGDSYANVFLAGSNRVLAVYQGEDRKIHGAAFAAARH